jgi:hypothetical protein
MGEHHGYGLQPLSDQLSDTGHRIHSRVDDHLGTGVAATT